MAESASPASWEEFARLYGTSERDEEEFLNPPKLLPTGIRRLDEKAGGGLAPGYYALMAPPGAGKSALAIQIAVNVSVAGGNVLFVTAEMTRQQCIARAASCVSCSPGSNVAAFGWSGWERMGAEGNEAGRRQGLTAMRQLRACCPGLLFADAGLIGDSVDLADTTRLAAECGLDLLIVDYLQRIRPPEEMLEAEEPARVAAVSDAITEATKANRVPAIVVTAMGRQAQSSNRPTLSGGRGSSSIEYDAVGVWQLMRGRNETPDGHRELDLHITKNRRGPLTEEDSPIVLWFDGKHNHVYGMLD